MDIKVRELEGYDLEIAKLENQLKEAQRTINGIRGAQEARALEYAKNIKRLRERSLWSRIFNLEY